MSDQEAKVALLIDEVAINRQILLLLLARLGWRALQAESREQALKLSAEHSICLYIADTSMLLDQHFFAELDRCAQQLSGERNPLLIQVKNDLRPLHE